MILVVICVKLLIQAINFGKQQQGEDIETIPGPAYNIQKPVQGSFFFYLVFLSRKLTNHRTAGEGRGHFLNSSLPLPPASQTLRHQPSDYCRELTSGHSQQPDSNPEHLVPGWKSLTTKLCTLNLVVITQPLEDHISQDIRHEKMQCRNAILKKVKKIILMMS